MSIAAKAQDIYFGYKISFIIPVYNAENYLDDAVESILKQTLNFEKNCELILVNDGSTDGSEDICLDYEHKYPHNVTYIKQNNAGPGAARNAGIAAAEGKYICMPDSDDRLSHDVAEEAYAFFEKHYTDIEVIGLKWEFFEARTGTDNPLNYRFSADKVIDLSEDYAQFQGSASTAVFKSETLKKYKFNPSVGRWGEDLRFMAEFLLDNPRYGVITGPRYYYRKRRAKTSSLDLNRGEKSWYLDTPKKVWLDLFEYVEKKNRGVIPKFIQYMAAYELQFRFKSQSELPLSDSERDRYESYLAKILSYVDDDIILEQKSINIEFKYHMLSIKYGDSIFTLAQRHKWEYIYNGTSVYNARRQLPVLHPQLTEIKDKSIIIEGYCTRFIFNGTKLQFKVADVMHDVEYIKQPHIEVKSLGKIIYTRNAFKVELPLANDNFIRAYFVSGDDKLRLKITPNSISGFSKLSFSYRVTQSWIIKFLPNEFYIQGYSRSKHIKAEARRILELFEIKDYNIIGYRLAYYTAKLLYRRPIWLVADRTTSAGDNGEAFFTYMSRQSKPKINVYFILEASSMDFDRLSNIGKVIKHGSLKHKILYLLSNKLIVSQIGPYFTNPFGRGIYGISDLKYSDLVFLQHGITKDDISKWTNKYRKNIKLLVTAAKEEYRAFLDNPNYGYDTNVVKLTGFPRFDVLQSNPIKKIIIAPTYRNTLVKSQDPLTGKRPHNESFKTSEYYIFYQKLISDKRLIDALRNKNMIAEFFLHDSHALQRNDFQGSEQIIVKSPPYDYRKSFSEADLLVTDYSSVAFDFAYLKKPILYSQFDRHTFYTGHTYSEGYFDYSRDGFGPVVFDYEETVEAILGFIQSGCVMDSTYQKRVDNFFRWKDKNNCQRVYKAILSINESNGK